MIVNSYNFDSKCATFISVIVDCSKSRSNGLALSLAQVVIEGQGWGCSKKATISKISSIAKATRR